MTGPAGVFVSIAWWISTRPLGANFRVLGEVDIAFLGGGFKYFLFLPLLWEDSHFD